MITLDNVTLVTINCLRVLEPLMALRFSMKSINFKNCKFFTSMDLSPESFGSDIEFIKIPNLNYEQYSKFVVYELHKYIHTDFVLIIQDDGYVINPHLWRDEFTQYDYIGAPWGIPQENDKISYRDPFGNLIRVGNGGFSLRSKKLLSLPTILDLEWKSYHGYFNEDGFFSCHNRHILQENGCKFAPLEVAKYFSHETDIPEIRGIQPFGFHGKWSKYIHLAYVN